VSNAEGPDGKRGDRNGAPFDDSFVSGAKYHEASARERARWVKNARRTKRRNVRARRESHVRGLGTRLRPWGILAALTLVYWWSGR